MRSHRELFWCDQVYKPGSVLTAIYLALRLLAGSSRLLGTTGPVACPSTALLRIEFTPSKCLHQMSALLPHFFILTGTRPAVIFCCTFPGVTPGGRYPLSLPYGARTFLIWGLSAPIRGCPTWLRGIFYMNSSRLSNILQIFLRKDILYSSWKLKMESCKLNTYQLSTFNF